MSEWRIHLGAHKTATTHLQQTLAELGFAPDLEEFRSRFWRTPEQRRILGRDVLEHRRWSAITSFSSYQVLSDENILCEAHEACLGFDNPTIRRRLRKLAARVDRKSARAFLCVRHPADFAASVYSEALRHHPDSSDRERTRAVWGKGGQWLHLVRAIADFFELTVWRYEDYRQNRLAIMSELVGRPTLHSLPDLPDPPQTKRLLAVEVAVIEARRGQVAEKPLSLGDGKFVLFDEAERARLSATYEEEIADISSIAKVLTFHP